MRVSNKPRRRPRPGRARRSDAERVVSLAATQGAGTPASVVFTGADIVVNGAGTLRTRPLRIAAGADAVSRDETFAQAWNAAPDAQIELREVVSGDETPEAVRRGGAGGAGGPVSRSGGRCHAVQRSAGAQADPAAVCGRWALKAG